jgi:hypothetical protein
MGHKGRRRGTRERTSGNAWPFASADPGVASGALQGSWQPGAGMGEARRKLLAVESMRGMRVEHASVAATTDWWRDDPEASLPDHGRGVQPELLRRRTRAAARRPSCGARTRRGLVAAAARSPDAHARSSLSLPTLAIRSRSFFASSMPSSIRPPATRVTTGYGEHLRSPAKSAWWTKTPLGNETEPRTRDRKALDRTRVPSSLGGCSSTSSRRHHRQSRTPR